VIPRWFAYLQGFAMLILGVSMLVTRPREKGASLSARFVNLGTLWALVCCGVGAALLAMALGYWSWSLPPAGAPAPAAGHHSRHRG
jgi:hypothetical protein